MTEPIITSESPAKPSKTKKRKMSAAGRKAVSEAAKARWAAKKATAEVVAPPAPVPMPQPIAPAPPSPAVLKLQEQVVELVTQRHQARTALNEAHQAHLVAQSGFQAAEGELKGIEQEVQYRIGLIAQLENRAPVTTIYEPAAGTGYPGATPILQMPAGGTITSEPAQQPQRFAVALADDVKRDFRGMM